MNLITIARGFRYRRVYKEHGFFWNDELAQFVRAYGGHQVHYRHPHMDFTLWADFRFPELISGAELPARNSDYYVSTAKYLGEDVALVGQCEYGGVYLLLTEKGNFVGFDEYKLIRWGTADLGWRDSVKHFLEGMAPTTFGDILAHRT